MTPTLYTGGRIFTADPSQQWAEAIVLEDEIITFVGDTPTASAQAGPDASVVDLEGRLILPGFIDAHTHLLWTGESLHQVPLTDARTLEEIQERLRTARRGTPQPVLRGRGWLFDSIPGGKPTAAMLDAAVADIPVFLDANDYHSCWINTAALALLGITRETPDPPGGRIGRDASGEPDGMLFETAAQQIAWPYLDSITTDDDRDQALERVFDAYLESGVTAAVDMGLNEVGLAAIQRALTRHGGQLPVRIAAYWLVNNTGDSAKNLAQIERVKTLFSANRSGWFRVVGIKIVLDGVIDACTAALSAPYSDGTNAEPMWPADLLDQLVLAADAAGLQVAAHAIGDRASTLALDAIEHAIETNGPRPRLHRIEHLEYTAPGTAERMARLGVTASMQPVHADPAIFSNWAEQLGDVRVDRAFAWPEYEAAGTLLAFSTDAPTAPHQPLPNMYIAATRASALDERFPAVHPQYALTLDSAIGHGTRDAAASVGDGTRRGRLRAGYDADLIVVDVDPFTVGASALLTARVTRTLVAGITRHDARDPA